MYLIVVTLTQWFKYFLHCPLILFVMTKLYIIHFLPWLVLARAEQESYPGLKIEIVGPHSLCSLENFSVYVHG